MKTEAIREELEKRKIKGSFVEEDGLVSIDFIWRGLSYHIWEYEEDDGSRGCETNVFTTGKTVDLTGDYEETILQELRRWPLSE